MPGFCGHYQQHHIVHDAAGNVNFSRKSTPLFPEKRKLLLQKSGTWAIIGIHIALPISGAGREYAVRGKRELPVGARQNRRRRIRSFHAAGDEFAGRRPLQRTERLSAERRAAIWVATRSFSSHTDEGSFYVVPRFFENETAICRNRKEVYLPCWTSICCARRRTLCARI